MISRITVRFQTEDAIYFEGLAQGLDIPVSELIRDVTRKYAPVYAAEVRKKGRPEGFRRRTTHRPHVDVVEALTKKTNLPAEVVRRRLLAGQVLLDGQPYRKTTIAPRLLPSLTFA